MPATVRLGTRGSPLALAQARMVKAGLIAAHGWGDDAVEIVTIVTDGDRIQDRPLAELGGKALWTKALDRALVAREIDFAVHSMKDVETLRPAEIVIAAVLERADVRDRLIGAASIDALERGTRVGTSSPRRAAQLRHLRPDLTIVPFRGNVATRLAKLDRGEVDATLLAAAGLDRLGRHDVGAAIPVATMTPACAQAAIGIEARADDAETRAWLSVLDHAPTRGCVEAERAFLAALKADCHSPVGALATIADGKITLTGELLSEDGRERVRGALTFGDEGGPPRLAARLLVEAPPTLRAAFG